MEPLNVECDLQSLRRLYSLLLLLQSNANKEYVPQTFLLDENSQFLLKRLLDSATEELLARQHKVLAQAQLGLPEKVSTPSTKTNSVSRGIVKLPSKAALTHEVVDSIERIETQLSAFQFCSSRGDRTRSCKSPGGVTPTEEEGYSSSVMTFQRLNEKALMEPRQSYLRSRQMRHTTRTSSVAPSLRSVTNNATVRSRYDPDLALQSHSSHDDQIGLATSRPPRPLRSVGFEKPSRTSQKMASMKPTLLLDQGIDTGTSSESEQQVYSTEQESDEAYGGETVSTSGSSWETHAESVTESDSSYPSESEGDDENPQVSDSPPHNRSRGLAKQRKNGAGRLKRFKDKLGKVFHHHHYHHHEHHNKEEEQGRQQGRKPSAWKHLVKKHLHKDKEKLLERRMKSESKGLTTHNNKGGQFHALVKGFMRHHRRHSKNKNKKLQTPKRQGGVKLPKRGRVKSEKTNYLCNKDQEHDEN
ncbi:hypothetical protein IGI04_023936 [Brassica rapa subsp. trilocularis]|uniref:Uncharacterized protein n=1 Tax=Brassica rapa subsp. trilocularis TaxID=1813537 RepID=A0ABQ7M7E8_BRACM|nr:hypothetical protein IGI04_023936 [Brassica rapa subsp. trilocularis]